MTAFMVLLAIATQSQWGEEKTASKLVKCYKLLTCLKAVKWLLNISCEVDGHHGEVVFQDVLAVISLHFPIQGVNIIAVFQPVGE